jgi:hypothetical protein
MKRMVRGFRELRGIWVQLVRGGVSAMQTLLVGLGCEGALGLLPGLVAADNPGRPRLGSAALG